MSFPPSLADYLTRSFLLFMPNERLKAERCSSDVGLEDDMITSFACFCGREVT